MATQMPPVTQFTLPTPGQSQPQQAPASQPSNGMPSVAQFQLPASAQQPQTQPTDNVFSNAGTNIASGNSKASVQGLIGSLKGIGQIAQSADVLDTMNKLAGQPSVEQRLGVTGNPLAPSNLDQAKGAAMTQIGASLIPMGEGGAAISRAVKGSVEDIAKEIASEKPTLGNVAKGLMSFGENPQTAKDAKAIEPLVESGALRRGTGDAVTEKNTISLQSEISNTSSKLINDLKNREIQPIVQPEDLDTEFQKGVQKITDEADNPEQAMTKLNQYWKKFTSFLPKDRDVTAADTLKARQNFDSWLGNINRNSIFDPAVENNKSIAARIVRQAANNIVIAKAPDVAVRDSLDYQTSLYNVLENVAKKGAPAVKKAQEIAATPGLKGILLRHPYAAGAAGLVGTGLLEGAGLGAAAKYTGLFNPNQ